MAKLLIDVDCGKYTCDNCRRKLRGSTYELAPLYCLMFSGELRKNSDGSYPRLPECIAAEGEYGRLEEIEKEYRQWNDADCNKCPLKSREACDEICKSMKTMIEKIAELEAELDGKEASGV